MTALNERAWGRLQRTVEEQARLGISVRILESGTWLVDAGINLSGGLEAGLAMAETGMADLGTADLELAPLLGVTWPWVTVRSDHPLEACFLSQAAHWQVRIGDFQAMGSGPACLLNRDLDPGRAFDFQENSDCAVLVLETRQLPEEAVCRSLAKSCGVKPEKLALLIAPTSSLAGSAQIAARSIETGMHKLQVLGFDLHRIASGMGRCPIAAPTGDDLRSLGLTNDLVLSASQVWLAVQGIPDLELEGWVEKLPASASPSYGPPFLEALKAAGGFYQLDPGLFAPAEASLTSLDTGRVHRAGALDEARLERILGG